MKKKTEKNNNNNRSIVIWRIQYSGMGTEKEKNLT